MILSMLVVAVQSCSVAIPADEFPAMVGQLCEKEESRPPLHVEGVYEIPLPEMSEGISTTFLGEIASDGRYSLAVSTPWESRHYWCDSKIAFSGKGALLELDHPTERAPMSLFLENMLSPSRKIVEPLFRDAEAFKIVVEESATSEIAGHLEYIFTIKDSADINLKIELDAEGSIAELRVSEVGGSPGVSVHTFGRYERLSGDIRVPHEYEHRLEDLNGEREPSLPLVVSRIKLTRQSLAANDSSFAPDQTRFSDVRDYRKGIRKLEKATGAWVDGVKNFFGF